MSDNIKISYAYDKERDRQISVHKAEKGKDYECLECRGTLRKRGGEGTTRREHFYHYKPNGDCKITEETNLHNGSKLFLKECLEDNKDPIIFFETDVLPDIKLRPILNRARINIFRISVIDLINVLMTVNKAEDSIDGSNYIGDVVSRNVDGSIAMVWEIRVTHEIEPEKRQWLEQNKIPYIELKPSEYEFDEFKYEVISFGNIDLFKQDRFSFDEIKEFYENEIKFENKKYLKNYFKDINTKLREQPIQIMDLKWYEDFRNSVKKYLDKFRIITIKQNYYNEKNLSKSSNDRFEELKAKDISLILGKYSPYLIFKGIKTDSFTNLTGEFFRILGNELGAMGLFDDKKEFYGVMFSYLDLKLNNQNKLITLKEIDLNKTIGMLNFAFIKYNMKSKEYEFNSGNCSQVSFPKQDNIISFDSINERIINSIQKFNNKNKQYKIQNLAFNENANLSFNGERTYFSAPAALLKKTLEELKNNGVKIEIIIQKSTDDNELVTGFRLSNIYSISKYNTFIEEYGNNLANTWITDFFKQLSDSLDCS